MRFVWFLISLGAGYGIVHPFAHSETTAGLLAWAVGVPLFLAGIGVVRFLEARRTGCQLDALSRFEDEKRAALDELTRR